LIFLFYYKFVLFHPFSPFSPLFFFRPVSPACAMIACLFFILSAIVFGENHLDYISGVFLFFSFLFQQHTFFQFSDSNASWGAGGICIIINALLCALLVAVDALFVRRDHAQSKYNEIDDDEDDSQSIAQQDE